MSGKIRIGSLRTQLFSRESGHFAAQVGALLLLVLVVMLLSGCGQDEPKALPTSTVSPTSPPSPRPEIPTNPPFTSVPATKSPLPTPLPLENATPRGSLPDPTGAPDSKDVPVTLRNAYQTATNDLIKRNKQVTPDSIKLLSYSSEDFSDSSLGCPQPNQMYTQVITPGYVLNLDANGITYIYHTNLAGTRVVLCNNGPLTNPRP